MVRRKAKKAAGRVRRRRVVALTGLSAIAAGSAIAGFQIGTADPGGPAGPDASVLTDRQLAGQRVIFGVPTGGIPDGLRNRIRDGAAAGVILFERNLPSRSAGRELIRRLQQIPGPPEIDEPLLIMVDQEGGQVKRLDGAPSASAQAMGGWSTDRVRREGRRTATNLLEVGFNVDLAPVLDVGYPRGFIEAQQRTFSDDSSRVLGKDVAFAEGLQAMGVAATAKHFPGLGRAKQNTDLEPTRIETSAATLRSTDQQPFRDFAAAAGDLVMLSTASYPKLGSSSPASLTRKIATDELRTQAGFTGVSISDSLTTPAARAAGSDQEVAFMAARAGTDLLLYTNYGPARDAAEALLKRLTDAELDPVAFEVSVQRVLDLRASF